MGCPWHHWTMVKARIRWVKSIVRVLSEDIVLGRTGLCMELLDHPNTLGLCHQPKPPSHRASLLACEPLEMTGDFQDHWNAILLGKDDVSC